MALESKLLAVPKQTFTANGTSDGQIIIADPALFKIKQIVIVGSSSQPSIELQIKRIADGIIHVGPFDDNLETRTDVSVYTAGSFIFANEQLRPWIPRDGVIPNYKPLEYTYEEAPTVAQRNMLVDKSGEPIDTVEVSGVRRLAVETSVSISTTSSGVQDVNVVNQPIAVTVSGTPAVTVTNVVTTSGVAPVDVQVQFPAVQDVRVINQHNVTVSGVAGVVNISGVVDFQRPVHVIVDSAPESVATISGIISVSGIAEQPVRIENVVRVSGVVDIQRPLHVIVDSAPESVATISGIIMVSGVAEQPVRVENVVRVSGIVDIQRPLDVNVLNSPPVNIPEPLEVEVVNSLIQHNVTVSGITGIVQISGIVDIQRPLHVIVDSAPESVTTISGVITVSGIAEQPVRITNEVPVTIQEPLDVQVTNSLLQHNVTVSGVVQISGIVDIQRPLDTRVINTPTVNIGNTVTVSGISEQPVRVESVVRISGVVDFQRPVTMSGIGGEFIQGVADFTKFPIFGSHFTQTISYTAPDLIEYVGWAPPGSGKADAAWVIMKLTYSGVSVLDTQWAAGNRLFNKVWNDRTTYLYS